jgi:hypothetical protein
MDDFVIIDIPKEKYIEIVDKKPSNYNYLLSDNNFCYLYPIRKYIVDIISSYEDDNKLIEKQLQLDLPRMNIYIDSKIINDLEEFYYKMARYELYYDSIANDKLHLIIALCTQASMGAVFEILSLLYTDADKDLFLMESKKPFKVRIFILKSEIVIKLNKIFHVIETETGNNKYEIHFKTKINLDLYSSTYMGFILFKWSVINHK